MALAPKKKIVIQAGDAFIDNREWGLPHLNFRHSEIELSVDNESQGSFTMDEAFPSADLALQPGEHIFKFTAHLSVIGGQRTQSDCSGVFNVTQQTSEFHPYLKIHGIQGVAAILSKCSLTAAD